MDKKVNLSVLCESSRLDAEKNGPFIVVRLTTENYFSSDKKTVTFAKKVRLMKSLCRGAMQDVFDDLWCDYIDNLYSSPDGLYFIDYVGMSKDYESSHWEWECLTLIPYVEEK